MKDQTEINVMAGYRVIGLVCRAILVSGIRIAHAKELRSIKMLVDPENCCPEDLDVLGTLEEPHVKLVHQLICYIHDEILDKYRIMNVLEDEDVLEDAAVERTACNLFNRFVFYRTHHRRRDRYLNLNHVLFTTQRALYEWCKLMLTGETRALDRSYRCNYTDGRLNALISDCTDSNVNLVVELIYELQTYEAKSRKMLSK